MERGAKLLSIIKLSIRSISFSWQVNPLVFIGRMLVKIAQAITPVAQAWLSAAFLASIVKYLAGSGSSTHQIYVILAALSGITLFNKVVSSTSRYLDYLFNYHFDRASQQQMFRAIGSLDDQLYDDPEFNSQLTKVQQNRSALHMYVNALTDVFSSFIRFTAILVSILAIAPFPAMLAIAGTIPTLWIEFQVNKAQFSRWTRTGEYWRMFSNAEYALTTPRFLHEIKLLNLHEKITDIWNHYFSQSRGENVKIERDAMTKRSVAEVIDTLTYTVALVWLLKLVLTARKLSFQKFLFARNLLDETVTVASNMLFQVQNAQDNIQYVSDYFEVVSTKPSFSDGEMELPAGKPPKIEFKNVSFTYPGTKRSVLNDISFVVEPGESVAFVGQNGAGKSTILKLLLRLYRPTKGQIFIHDIDLNQVTANSWYRLVGTLFQDFTLFQFLSAGDNIGFGQAEVDDQKRLIDAAKRADAHSFITKFPKGYEQKLQKSFKDGIDASGGQLQRIAIARAFYRDAQVLILDEPTSAIDAKAEQEIFKEIRRTQEGKSSIIVSHRFSTVRQANKIIVIEDGNVVEQGSHEKLLKNNGSYAELFNAQAEGYQ